MQNSSNGLQGPMYQTCTNFPKLIKTRKDENNFDGTISVNFKIYKDEFTSYVQCISDDQTGNYKVTSTTAENAMFREMVSVWNVTEITKNSGTSEDKSANEEIACNIDYDIHFEFQNSWYNSAAGYFIGIIGAATYAQFIARAKNLYLKDEDESMTGMSGSEVSERKKFEKKFVEQKKMLMADFHILGYVNILFKDDLLTKNEYDHFVYFWDKTEDFQTRIELIFDMFDDAEEIEQNKDKLLFFIKKAISEFIRNYGQKV